MSEPLFRSSEGSALLRHPDYLDTLTTPSSTLHPVSMVFLVPRVSMEFP